MPAIHPIAEDIYRQSCPDLYRAHRFNRSGPKMINDKAVPVEEALKKLIMRATHNNDIVLRSTATFKDLGADSLDVVHIMVAIEDMYGIDLRDDELKSISNIGGFVDYIKMKLNEKK